MKKRDRLDILTDMLVSIQQKGGIIKPTHLMYKANIAHRQLKSYLEELIDKNFVEKVMKNNYEYILITDRGHRFISKMREMKEFENTFGFDSS